MPDVIISDLSLSEYSSQIPDTDPKRDLRPNLYLAAFHRDVTMVKWLSLAFPVPLRFTALRKFLSKVCCMFGWTFLWLDVCFSRQQPIYPAARFRSRLAGTELPRSLSGFFRNQASG